MIQGPCATALLACSFCSKTGSHICSQWHPTGWWPPFSPSGFQGSFPDLIDDIFRICTYSLRKCKIFSWKIVVFLALPFYHKASQMQYSQELSSIFISLSRLYINTFTNDTLALNTNKSVKTHLSMTQNFS